MKEEPDLQCTDIGTIRAMAKFAERCHADRRFPGCAVDFLEHPTRNGAAVRVAVVAEHRYAFPLWVYWNSEMVKEKGKTADRVSDPAVLVTLDSHNDVGSRGDVKPGQLRHLDLTSHVLLSLFAWTCLPNNNDGHILPAVYLNAIGDVYVLLSENYQRLPVKDFDFENGDGISRQVRYFSNIADLADCLDRADPAEIVLDVDLDYFTKCENGRFDGIRLVPDDQVGRVVELTGPLMSSILPRLLGITIALEPKYCSGLQNSLHLLGVVNEHLFSPSLFASDCAWRRRSGAS